MLVTGGTGSFGDRFRRGAARGPRARGGPRLQPRRAQAVGARAAAGRRPAAALLPRRRARPRAPHAGLRGVDVVVHAAALKQVPACEYNPFEAVQTNIVGAENVVSAAIEAGVPQTLVAQHRQGGQPGQPLRRHQAVRREDRRPGQRLRGGRLARRASRPCATATSWAAAAASSRSSSKQAQEGELTITDEAMTRFWITLEQAVRVRDRLPRADGGRRDLRAQDPEHAGGRHRRRAGARRRARRSSASGPARRSTRCCSPRSESRNASASTTTTRSTRRSRSGATRTTPAARSFRPASLLERHQRRVAGRGRAGRDGRSPRGGH